VDAAWPRSGGVSDCADFAPNNPTPFGITALSSRLPPSLPPFFPFTVRLVFPLRLVKEETSRKRQKDG